MRRKRLRNTLLESHDLCGFIRILLPAFIAPNHESVGNNRLARESIGFTERNPMPKKFVLFIVKSLILADDYPAVLACIPHICTPKEITVISCGVKTTVWILPQSVQRNKNVELGIIRVSRTLKRLPPHTSRGGYLESIAGEGFIYPPCLLNTTFTAAVFYVPPSGSGTRTTRTRVTKNMILPVHCGTSRFLRKWGYQILRFTEG
jgi:hypothetical protein